MTLPMILWANAIALCVAFYWMAEKPARKRAKRP